MAGVTESLLVYVIMFTQRDGQHKIDVFNWL